ncbi:carbohydrate ABC transporter permease [Paenibacillus rigui]|uniref:ABC transporter permease n=1 Tax=Paenibacillus rigui TaxID=554312 RepID=A0A229UJR1_9BACL|nr:carbohydrate ABC transporter permease [Paenibacillus rigui]OXM83611.1 ABC transporter permease [Paenibacillus rigui]
MIGMSISRKAFIAGNYIVLACISLSMLFPFLNILAGSFSSGSAILQGKVTIVPVQFNIDNYMAVFSNPGIWRSFGVTVYITVVGTAVSLLLTSLMAYGLSRQELKGRSFMLLLIVFTMIFQIPVIPNYLLVKGLGLLNSLWSLIIPSAVSAYNLIIMVSFFRNLETGLLEAAKIDGCSEYKLWWKIVLPISLPSITTIGLFYAVSLWNGYYNAVMYLRDPALYPLQVKLRQLLVGADAEEMMQGAAFALQSMEGIKMATIIFATLPVLIIYPMIQKHFVKGSMLGSVKG